jgi:hypothetical protein
MPDDDRYAVLRHKLRSIVEANQGDDRDRGRDAQTVRLASEALDLLNDLEGDDDA